MTFFNKRYSLIGISLAVCAACSGESIGATTGSSAQGQALDEGATRTTASLQQSKDVAQFSLTPNPRFVDCLVNDKTYPPEAKVTVTKGKLNDELILELSNIKPGLAFDLFTVQRSPLVADGKPDPNFKNFGLAWYQSDIEADAYGRASVTIRTILLNQIFGFDPDVALPPTNTFHVGFWFNDPKDAQACGFDVNAPTPFNGEHKAGPLAMISLPDQQTGLGPLCTDPNTSTTPATCNP